MVLLGGSSDLLFSSYLTLVTPLFILWEGIAFTMGFILLYFACPKDVQLLAQPTRCVTPGFATHSFYP